MAASHHDATLNTDPYTTSLDSTESGRLLPLACAQRRNSSTRLCWVKAFSPRSRCRGGMTRRSDRADPDVRRALRQIPLAGASNLFYVGRMGTVRGDLA